MDYINEIEAIIQYEFNNKALLLQAFKFNPDFDEIKTAHSLINM